ncbi:MAG: GAF domain-containing sensor histidine kinase [Dehalococcoidia bacterium]
MTDEDICEREDDEVSTALLGIASSVASKISTGSTLQDICGCALDEAVNLTRASCAEILLRDNESLQLVCLAHRGPFPWCSAELEGQKLGARLFQVAAESGRAVVISALEDAARIGVKAPPSGQLPQALAIPLRVSGQTIGALNLCGDERVLFDEERVRLLGLLATMVALAIENAHLYREADAKARLRRQLLAREIKVQEEERRRIARELHDEAGQSLTGLIMTLDTIDQALTTNGQGQIDELLLDYLSEARRIASSTLQEIRRLIFDLRPTLLDDLGLAAAIDWYAKTALAKADIEAVVKADRLDDRLPLKMEIALYRIVQEAISNVIKHSYARRCTLTLTSADKAVELVIADDGKGFDPEKIGRAGEEHLGIVGMQERVRSLDGQLTIQSRPREGTRIEIRIPLPATGGSIEDPSAAG